MSVQGLVVLGFRGSGFLGFGFTGGCRGLGFSLKGSITFAHSNPCSIHISSPEVLELNDRSEL